MKLERLVYTPKEISQILGMSYRHTLKMIHEGKIKSIEVGGKILVSKITLEKILSGAKD